MGFWRSNNDPRRRLPRAGVRTSENLCCSEATFAITQFFSVDPIARFLRNSIQSDFSFGYIDVAINVHVDFSNPVPFAFGDAINDVQCPGLF